MDPCAFRLPYSSFAGDTYILLSRVLVTTDGGLDWMI
jgi:hypothetical protein